MIKNFFFTFFIILIFVFIVVLIAVAFTIFKKRKKVNYVSSDNSKPHIKNDFETNKPKMLEAEKNLLQTYYNKYSKKNTASTQIRKTQTQAKNKPVSLVGKHKYLSEKKAQKDSFIVIDIETTGLNSINDEIIEIAAIKVIDINSLSHDTFQILIKPKKDISIEIQNLTGITNEMLSKGDTIENALQYFSDFIEDYPLIGHNINFDIKFLDNKMKKAKLNFSNKELIDTLELSRKAFKDVENHKLITLKDYLKIYTENHRALSDAHATLLVYFHSISKIY